MDNVLLLDLEGNPIKHLYQWDTEQYISIVGIDVDAVTHVHFCNIDSDSAVVVGPTIDGNNIVARVPNKLLQLSKPVIVYLYGAGEESGGKTLHAFRIVVVPRPKPEDYVYTEDEVLHYVQLDNRICALEDKISQHSNSVLYEKQELSQEQKAQARENIGAAGALTEYSGEIFNDYENNEAIGAHSHAEGRYTLAGCKGYYIRAIEPNITDTTGYIYLETNEDVKPIPSWIVDDTTYESSFVSGYEVLNDNDSSLDTYVAYGNEFSVSADGYYHWAFAGNIIAIDGNKITYQSDSLNTSEKWLSNVNGGADPCIFFVPVQYRVGITSLGLGSHAEGWCAHAAAQHSHAEGYCSIAAGRYGHAEGDGARAGYAAHAEGCATKAIGLHSHAEGHNTLALGASAHAQGGYTTASGTYSSAEGESTIASGYNTHAEGNKSHAKGKNSHAEGYGGIAEGENSHKEGQATQAIGKNSHAEGQSSIASGFNSHAEGGSTSASGIRSHAEGDSSSAGGTNAHAEGRGTSASGYAAHAEGDGTTAGGADAHAEGKKTTASGNNSHAEGYSTTASESNAHAEGDQTVAGGENAHAEGKQSKATTDNAHAEGSYTEASGDSSHAEGYNSVSSGRYSHAEGSSNRSESESSHAEGCGTYAGNHYGYEIERLEYSDGCLVVHTGTGSYKSASKTYAIKLDDVIYKIGTSSNSDNRVNSHKFSDEQYLTIYEELAAVDLTTISEKHIYCEQNPRWGDCYLFSGKNSHAEGFRTSACRVSAHAEGEDTVACGDHSHAEGTSTVASGSRSHTEGSNTKASAFTAHAEGHDTIASGDSSHAEGNFTKAIGKNTHSEGYGTTAEGENAHAEGASTSAIGKNSHSEGYDSIASGYTSHAEGVGTVASGNFSHAGGNHTIADQKSQTAIGQYNATDSSALFIIGNGEGDTNRGNAFVVHKNGNTLTKGDAYVQVVGEAKKKLATEEYVDDKISSINTVPESIQIKDRATSKIYNVFIENGELRMEVAE